MEGIRIRVQTDVRNSLFLRDTIYKYFLALNSASKSVQKRRNTASTNDVHHPFNLNSKFSDILYGTWTSTFVAWAVVVSLDGCVEFLHHYASAKSSIERPSIRRKGGEREGGRVREGKGERGWEKGWREWGGKERVRDISCIGRNVILIERRRGSRGWRSEVSKRVRKEGENRARGMSGIR